MTDQPVTVRTAVLISVALVLLVGCSAQVTVSSDNEVAAEYCEETGGSVETRRARWNTNADQSQWVELPGELELCWYRTLGDEDESRIYLDLVTLYSDTPTLAAAAYLSRLPMGRSQGNPAEAHCQQLNGTAYFGTAAAAGGGWVNLEDEEFTVVQLCMFADGSAIDAWGIAYYSDGTVRGIDLAEVFRFDPADVPTVFGQ